MKYEQYGQIPNNEVLASSPSPRKEALLTIVAPLGWLRVEDGCQQDAETAASW